MKQPPFFDKESNDDSEKLWAYIDGSLSDDEIVEFENALKESLPLQQELERCRQLWESLQNYQQQAVPDWNPTSIYRSPLKAKSNSWLPMAIAATALVVSLFPYIHINDNNVSLGSTETTVSNQQLEQAFENFGFQQSVAFSERLEQLKADQNIKNQQLVVSILNYAEKRRRNDLLQMASWFSRQTELNQNQQRQIVNWVANEQQQDQQAISTLFNSINDSAYPVSNEVQP